MQSDGDHSSPTWWTFRILFISFCPGRGGGARGARRAGGVSFSIANPRGGVFFQEREGPEGVRGESGTFG